MRYILIVSLFILSLTVNAQVNLKNGIHMLNPKPVDNRYGAWPSLAAAKAGVIQARRHDGLTVKIIGLGEYWWLQGDFSDSGLIPKNAGATLPNQIGNSGKYLTTDGVNPSWATVASSTSTASNGLTKIGNDFKLGGTLTANTNLDGGLNTLSFTNFNGVQFGSDILGVTFNNASTLFTKQAQFTSDATNAAIHINPFAGEPSNFSNGSLWYNSNTNKLMAGINGNPVEIGNGAFIKSGGATNITSNIDVNGAYNFKFGQSTALNNFFVRTSGQLAFTGKSGSINIDGSAGTTYGDFSITNYDNDDNQSSVVGNIAPATNSEGTYGSPVKGGLYSVRGTDAVDNNIIKDGLALNRGLSNNTDHGANGIGVALAFNARGYTGYAPTARIKYYLNDVVAATEDGQFDFNLPKAGVDTKIGDLMGNGFHYNADYSSGATSRWLTDKAYVDAAILAGGGGGGGSGTVTSTSVVSANGFSGTVATPSTTPAITLGTTITGLLKGNGTAISAATVGTDYIVPSGALGTPSSGVATNITGLPPTTGIAGWPANAGGILANNGSGTLSWAPATGTVSSFQTAYVDSGTGNDGTGVLGRLDKPYLTINAALDAGAGAANLIVKIAPGTYASPLAAKMRSNLWLQGSGKPNFNVVVSETAYATLSITQPTKLVGGTILNGSLDCVDRSQVKISDLGVDVGSDYVTGGGAEANCIGIGSTTSVAPFTLLTGIELRNISCLGKDAASLFHCIVLENTYNPVVYNVDTYFGVHGLVIKGIGGNFSNFRASYHGGNGIIIKSDTYAFNAYTLVTNFLINNSGTGVSIYLGSSVPGNDHVTISDGIIRGGTKGVNALSAGGTTVQSALMINNVKVIAPSNHGFDIGASNNFKISGCYVQTAGATGFYVHNEDNATYGVIENCTVVGATFNGFTYGADVGRIIANNNTAINCAWYGHSAITANIFGSGNTGFNNTLGLQNGDINNGQGVVTPTAKLHIAAGTTTASTAPIKLTSGSLLTTPETGAIEFDGTHYYGTVSSTRFQLDNDDPIATISTSTTLNTTHHTILVDATSGNVTLTLPAAASSNKRTYIIKKIDGSVNSVIIDGNGANIDATSTKSLVGASNQWSGYSIRCNGTQWYITGVF